MAAVGPAPKAVVAYIGLGSNLQDPIAQVRQALTDLEQLPESRVTARSSLYSSSPMGPKDQPTYINAVAQIETRLSPLALLGELQAIEDRHGRVRGAQRWGPRTLDLDLLLFGQAVIDEPTLTVPHPGVLEREFVLYPLAEIASDLTIPRIGKLADLLRDRPLGGLQRLAADGLAATGAADIP